METVVERLLVQNYDKYYRLALSYVHVPDHAMDVVQESALKALRKKHSLRQEAYADTWICRIVINEAVSFLRKRKREQPSESLPDAGKWDAYQTASLFAEVDALPHPDGAILRLRYLEDLPLKTVAEILQLPLSTVKTRLYRALAALKLKMEDEDHG